VALDTPDGGVPLKAKVDASVMPATPAYVPPPQQPMPVPDGQFTHAYPLAVNGTSGVMLGRVGIADGLQGPAASLRVSPSNLIDGQTLDQLISDSATMTTVEANFTANQVTALNNYFTSRPDRVIQALTPRDGPDDAEGNPTKQLVVKPGSDLAGRLGFGNDANPDTMSATAKAYLSQAGFEGAKGKDGTFAFVLKADGPMAQSASAYFLSQQRANLVAQGKAGTLQPPEAQFEYVKLGDKFIDRVMNIATVGPYLPPETIRNTNYASSFLNVASQDYNTADFTPRPANAADLAKVDNAVAQFREAARAELQSFVDKYSATNYQNSALGNMAAKIKAQGVGAVADKLAQDYKQQTYPAGFDADRLIYLAPRAQNAGNYAAQSYEAV
jgi:hypothetical protein